MAGMKACPACGKQIAKGAANCPHCGKVFTRPVTWLALIVFVALVLAMLAMAWSESR